MSSVPIIPTLLSSSFSPQGCKCHIYFIILIRPWIVFESKWSVLDIRRAFSTLKAPNGRKDVWAGRRDVFAACLFMSSALFILYCLLSMLYPLLNLGLGGSLKLAPLFMTLDRRGEVVILILIMHLKGMNVSRGKCQVSIAQLYHLFYQSFPLTGFSLSAKNTKHLGFCTLSNYLATVPAFSSQIPVFLQLKKVSSHQPLPWKPAICCFILPF